MMLMLPWCFNCQPECSAVFKSALGGTGGCHGYPFFHFSNCSVATFSEGGGPRSGSADSGSDPACGLAQLYVLRLPTQARPRGLSPSPSAGTRIPQVAGTTRPARLPAQKLQASAALSICIGFAQFPLVPASSATSSPNLVARWVSRRLPLIWPENRACFGGYRGLGPSIAGEQPKLCRSAAGNPSSRSLRSHGRHSDGNATAPPDSAPFRSYFRATMRSQRIRVCAAVQVAAILRIPPRKTCDLMGASLTTRTRWLHAASTWHRLAQWYEPAACAKKTIRPLRIQMVNRASSRAHTRLELRAASAGRFG